MGRPVGSKNKPQQQAKPAVRAKVNAPEIDEDDDIFDEDDEDEDAPPPKRSGRPKPPPPPIDDEDEDEDEDEDDDDEVELPQRTVRTASKPATAPVVTNDKPLTSKALQQALQAALDVLKAGG